MADESIVSLADRLRRRPCRHLQSKEMFYESHDAEDDIFSSGIYWCGLTQKSLGPDGKPADRPDCRGDRACCEP